MNDRKIIAEFQKLISKLSENSELTAEGLGELLSLTKDQLKSAKELNKKMSTPFQAERTDHIFESTDAEKKYQKRMIELEEERTEMTDEMLEEMADEMFEGLDEISDAIEDFTEENKKENERQAKSDKKREKRESERVDYFSMAIGDFSKTLGFVSKATGLDSILNFYDDLKDAVASQFRGLFSLVDTLVLTPLKGVGELFMGVGSFLFSPFKSMFGLGERQKEERKERKSDDQHSETTEYLAMIAGNTAPETEMIKGGSFLDSLKGMIPRPLIGGKIGGMLWKMAGAGMIIGGLYMAVKDFMDGFAEGGLGEGLYQAFVGKTDQGIMGSLKNAGKWALIGAGIGTFIAPVVGTIAGGILGGAIGFAINSVAQIFEGTGGVGSKLGTTIFGKSSGGYMEAIAVGGRWALLGATIGTKIAPGVGTIAGGVIGFVAGFLINFIYQILDPRIVSGLQKVFSKVGEWIDKTWDWLWGSVSSIFSSVWNIFSNYFNFWKGAVLVAVDIVMKGFGYIGDAFNWIVDKLGIREYIDKFKATIAMAWNKVKETFASILDWITTFATDIWDSFKTVMSQYWDRIKSFFGFGGKGDKVPVETKSEKVVTTTSNRETTKTTTKFMESGIESAKSLVKVAESSPKIEKQAVENNKVSKDLNKYVVSLIDYLRNDFIKRIEQMFQNSSNFIVDGMWNLSHEERMWRYATEHGSLSGYGSKVKDFSQELKKLERGGREGYEDKLKDVMNTSVDNSTSIVTNNSIIEGYSHSLRKNRAKQ